MKLPTYQLNHQAAQDAGHFTPYPNTTMSTPYRQPLPIIDTNARLGRPVSTRNRPRARRVNLPALLILLALVVFWIAAGLLVACAR